MREQGDGLEFPHRRSWSQGTLEVHVRPRRPKSRGPLEYLDEHGTRRRDSRNLGTSERRRHTLVSFWSVVIPTESEVVEPV